MNIRNYNLYTVGIVLICAGFFGLFNVSKIRASVTDDVAQKNKQIEEIQKQIDQYQIQIDDAQSKSLTLQSEIDSLNAQISQVQLEIRSLNLSINETALEINDTEAQVTEDQGKINKNKNALSQYIKIINENDQKTLTLILLNNQNLSDFFNDLNSVQTTQDNLRTTIDDIKVQKQSLETHQTELEDKKSELERLQNLQKIENKNLAQNKSQKNQILKDTKGQESTFQELVKKSQGDIEKIKNQIGYLLQNGISVEDAVKYGNLAAIATGIRPAFLLAELDHESAILNPSGGNVGRCYITDTVSGSSRNITTGRVSSRGINPTRDLPPFLSITRQLGKDPLQTPISCWPGYGWGGAMGPAQFIPSTWMGYTEQVATIVGRAIADPWNIEDAFTAAAIKFAKDGAGSKTRAGEIAASKAYYCGNPKSTNYRCVNYANIVQNKAAEIEQSL